MTSTDFADDLARQVRILRKCFREEPKELYGLALWRFVQERASVHRYGDGFVEWTHVRGEVDDAADFYYQAIRSEEVGGEAAGAPAEEQALWAREYLRCLEAPQDLVSSTQLSSLREQLQ